MNKLNLRPFLLWFIITAFVWVIISRFTEIEGLVKTLLEGQWAWLLVAASLQLGYYTLVAASYQAALTTVGVQSQTRKLLPLTFAAIFVNVVTPTASTAGAALYVDDAARRGESPARTTAGVLLQLSVDFTVFSLILLLGMIFLFTTHNLQTYQVIGALALLGLTLILSGPLALGLWQPARLQRWLAWVQRLVARLAAWVRRPPFLPEDWAAKNARDFTSAATAVAENPRQLWRTAAILLIAHLINITSLYAVFIAFRHPIDVGPLVAGYAIGILFWIVSPTPQGIGVVEGVMTLVFTSLNVPGSVATIIALAFRGLAFWIPLLVGFVVIRRVETFSMGPRTLSEVWVGRFLSIMVGLMGVINVISAITPSLPERLALLAQFSPLKVQHSGNLAAALSGFALLLLARNLWRRKRLAWMMTLGALILSVFSHLVKGLNYEEATLAAGLALLLWTQRYHFHAASDRPAMRQAVRVLAGAVFFTLAYGVAGFFLLDRHYSVTFGFRDAVRQTIIMFTEFYNPGLEPITGFGNYFADSIYAVGIVTFGYALWMLLRPVFVRPSADKKEEAHARDIIQAYGRTVLARFALFEDKSFYFSPGGSVVAYAARDRVGFALGDPIGPPEDVPVALEGFKTFCANNDWTPAFYQVLPDYLPDYKKANLEALCIGHEAVIDLSAFTLEGKAAKDMRTAMNRMAREGYRFELHPAPLSAEFLAELRTISDEWLATMHGAEKRFSLGWFDEEYLQTCPVAAVHALDGMVVAFANIITEFRKNEASLDLMRRRETIPNGTMEFLFASIFQWAKAQGYDTFNLGLSALSGVGEHPDDPVPEKMLHFIYEHINQFYNFQGLHKFKEKFNPTWEPRYLIYPSVAALPGLLTALVRIHASENFVWEFLKKPT